MCSACLHGSKPSIYTGRWRGASTEVQGLGRGVGKEHDDDKTPGDPQNDERHAQHAGACSEEQRTFEALCNPIGRSVHGGAGGGAGYCGTLRPKAAHAHTDAGALVAQYRGTSSDRAASFCTVVAPSACIDSSRGSSTGCKLVRCMAFGLKEQKGQGKDTASHLRALPHSAPPSPHLPG